MKGREVMCKFIDDIEEKRKKLDGIVSNKKLTDKEVIEESQNLDMILNKRNFKCLNCKKKCNKSCKEPRRDADDKK